MMLRDPSLLQRPELHQMMAGILLGALRGGRAALAP
jgi:hypothetical protein